MKKQRSKFLFACVLGCVVLLFSGVLAITTIVKRGSNTGTGSIHGTVTLFPIGPICSYLSQCSRPAAGQLVELKRLDGATVASTSANSHGEYGFRVQPGVYNLVVPADRYGRPGTKIPNPIHITRAIALTVNVTIDTGIR